MSSRDKAVRRLMLEHSLQLVKHPNPVLRKKADLVDLDNLDVEKMEDCLNQMGRIMMDNDGIGLAAPQCGILEQFFIMQVDDSVHYMINPTWSPLTDETISSMEGCLSFPDLLIPVDRFLIIEATYYDMFGKKLTTELSGLHARCFQHEADHLDGNCIDKKVSPLILSMAKRKARKARKQKNGI
tara:strand:+ start:435 stop:986 length:552 start_codon:yes stop_codon:yes gene_type:complete